VDGTFRINTPSVLLGYTYDLGGADDDLSPLGEDIGCVQQAPYISLFVTIEPPPMQPEAMRERVSTSEIK
jgi:coiled-coil and C2 domain-containing protein 2A